MKIRVLTLPLGYNIGGILQNYALMTICKKYSNDVKTLDICVSPPFLFPIIKYGACVKRFLLKIFVDHNIRVRWWLENKPVEKIQEIPQVKDVIYLHSTKGLKKIKTANTLFIFGSDQLWRKEMSPDIMTFFGDFLKDNVPRVAYAASFGVDTWQFDEDNSAKVIYLLKKFKAISVREESAVKLLAQRGIQSQLVLDPTLLLLSQSYISLETAVSRQFAQNPHIFLYCLDKHLGQDEAIALICNKVNTPVMNITTNLQVDKWICGLRTADYVVTDSFHGTIFSILFHKKFIVVANQMRGLTRLESLLKLLGLENRLAESFEDFDFTQLSADIDYMSVDKILNQEREKSLAFLDNQLKF